MTEHEILHIMCSLGLGKDLAANMVKLARVTGQHSCLVLLAQIRDWRTVTVKARARGNISHLYSVSIS